MSIEEMAVSCPEKLALLWAPPYVTSGHSCRCVFCPGVSCHTWNTTLTSCPDNRRCAACSLSRSTASGTAWSATQGTWAARAARFHSTNLLTATCIRTGVSQLLPTCTLYVTGSETQRHGDDHAAPRFRRASYPAAAFNPIPRHTMKTQQLLRDEGRTGREHRGVRWRAGQRKRAAAHPGSVKWTVQKLQL